MKKKLGKQIVFQDFGKNAATRTDIKQPHCAQYAKMYTDKKQNEEILETVVVVRRVRSKKTILERKDMGFKNPN